MVDNSLQYSLPRSENADRDRMEPGWWTDRQRLAEVQERVRALDRSGYSATEISAKIGISARTVVRIRRRARDTIPDPDAGTLY